MVRFSLRELIKSRVGAETEYGESDPHMRVGQYLCHTIKSHRVMKKFQEVDLHWNTSMAPGVVNQLFEHRAENVDVDILKKKIKE